jgi:hypothetical protein
MPYRQKQKKWGGDFASLPKSKKISILKSMELKMSLNCKRQSRGENIQKQDSSQLIKVRKKKYQLLSLIL